MKTNLLQSIYRCFCLTAGLAILCNATIIPHADAVNPPVGAQKLPSKAPMREKKFCIRLGVPAYAYPTVGRNFWTETSNVPITSVYILNPASGPGQKADPNYVQAIKKARQHQVRVYGYVDTAYGKRSVEDVVADMDRHRQFYAVDGIFLDQTQLDKANLPYFQQISLAAGKRRVDLIFNPGQPVIEPRYLTYATHIITFEGPQDQYRKTTFPAWQSQYPTSKFWHLVYGVPNVKAFQDMLTLAKKRPVGVFYATHDTMPNPWDALPPYWAEQLDAVCPKPY